MVEVTPRGKSIFDYMLMETMEEVGVQEDGEIGVDAYEELEEVDEAIEHASIDGEGTHIDEDSLSSGINFSIDLGCLNVEVDQLACNDLFKDS